MAGKAEGKADINIYGFLRRYREEKGLACSLEWSIPPGGLPAAEIAKSLDLPLHEIEAVFKNGHIMEIHDLVFPGDRVAFFPFGTPGPYRVLLGIKRE